MLMEDTPYHLRCVAYVDQLNNATHSQYSQRVSKLLPSPESIKQWMHKTNSQLDLWIRIPFRFPRWFDFGLSPISRSTDFNIVFDFFFLLFTSEMIGYDLALIFNLSKFHLILPASKWQHFRKTQRRMERIDRLTFQPSESFPKTFHSR